MTSRLDDCAGQLGSTPTCHPPCATLVLGMVAGAEDPVVDDCISGGAAFADCMLVLSTVFTDGQSFSLVGRT
jgi:hypothetical protein